MELPGILGEVLVPALVGKLVIPGHRGNEVFPVGAGKAQLFRQFRNGIGAGKQIVLPLVGGRWALGTVAVVHAHALCFL